MKGGVFGAVPPLTKRSILQLNSKTICFHTYLLIGKLTTSGSM